MFIEINPTFCWQSNMKSQYPSNIEVRDLRICNVRIWLVWCWNMADKRKGQKSQSRTLLRITHEWWMAQDSYSEEYIISHWNDFTHKMFCQVIIHWMIITQICIIHIYFFWNCYSNVQGIRKKKNLNYKSVFNGKKIFLRTPYPWAKNLQSKRLLHCEKLWKHSKYMRR